MRETTFYPRYTIRGSADILSLALLQGGVLLFSFLKFGATLQNLGLLLFLVFFIVWFSRLYIRRIVFMPSYFLIQRYGWASMRITYLDVIDMGRSKIKTRKGEISFAGMSNVAQLHSLFFEKMRQGQIDIDQFENKALAEEFVLEKSFQPAFAISFALFVIFFFYCVYHRPRLSSLEMWFGFTVIVLVIPFIIYCINKWRLKMP